ncbi:hypothetical protein SAMN05421743_10939 [Thalassobacillus cyri]|uniref:Uncharacterized protein n=1 Tax=Thalassobacillus cyri TaxID=571932 RepID=A0A1H4EF59_9BACI|nr:hypothetical protein [Thalassobacillus cyri]SEA83714.1 hypothetical protein SAMN05421743_10939 [Thalassobacillus cyri]
MEKKESLPLQMECTMLFQANPYMIESISGLERRLGRQEEDLKPVLNILVKQGILQQIGEGTASLYRYKEPVIITDMDIPDKLESP